MSLEDIFLQLTTEEADGEADGAEAGGADGTEASGPDGAELGGPDGAELDGPVGAEAGSARNPGGGGGTESNDTEERTHG